MVDGLCNCSPERHGQHSGRRVQHLAKQLALLTCGHNSSSIAADVASATAPPLPLSLSTRSAHPRHSTIQLPSHCCYSVPPSPSLSFHSLRTGSIGGGRERCRRPLCNQSPRAELEALRKTLSRSLRLRPPLQRLSLPLTLLPLHQDQRRSLRLLQPLQRTAVVRRARPA